MLTLQQDTNLADLLTLFNEAISTMGYGRALLSYYRNYGQMLMEYAERTDRSDCFNLNLAQDFLRDCIGVSLYQTPGEGKHSTRKAIAIRLMRLLDDMAHQRPFMNRYSRKDSFPLPQQYKEIIEEYKKHLRDYKGCTDRTLYAVRNVLRRFLHYMDTEVCYPLYELTESTVTEYVIGMQYFHPATIKGQCEQLKLFLQFLYDNGHTARNVTSVVPSVRVTRQAKIPSVWKAEDIAKLLGVVDRGSPGGKRDYAILLLASRMGLRATDIRSLQLQSLKWSNESGKSRMEIVQSKTKRPVYLPILPDIGQALIDYIQHGRPKTDSPYVFLRHNAPFKSFEPHNGLNNIIKKYADLAEIELSNEKKNGMHSLRHSFASGLVEKHIPLETVSGLMGHSNTQSTSVYLKVDLSNLRMCTLSPMETIQIEK